MGQNRMTIIKLSISWGQTGRLGRKYWNPFLLFVSYFVCELFVCLAFIKVMFSFFIVCHLWPLWKQYDGCESKTEAHPLLLLLFARIWGRNIKRGCVIVSRGRAMNFPLSAGGWWLGRVHSFQFFDIFWGSSPMKVMWSPLLEMVFPGQGALNL